MLFFNLGELPEQYSMTVFHALAYMEIESFVLVSPKTPLVSVGYFQNADGVDFKYCTEHGVSVMRRELGGGTTLLDHNQVFYQIILKKDNPLLANTIDQLYRNFSEPVINSYKALGVETRFKPVNDIVTLEGRKISGEGGGDIGDCIVFVGGILLDFDFDLMTRVLRIPDEKFRDKLYKTMEENISTLKRELGYVPNREEVVKVLLEQFSQVLGDLTPAALPYDVWQLASKLSDKYSTEEFLLRNHRVQDLITIGAGVKMKQGMFKAPGGLIQSNVKVEDGVITEIFISGDFTLYPKEYLPALSLAITGAAYERRAVKSRVTDFISRFNVEMPGVSEDDICNAIFAGI